MTILLNMTNALCGLTFFGSTLKRIIWGFFSPQICANKLTRNFMTGILCLQFFLVMCKAIPDENMIMYL